MKRPEDQAFNVSSWPASPAVWLNRFWVASALAAILVVGVGFVSNRARVPDPEFEGRKVSTWFGDLCSHCSGLPRATNYQVAYNAFARMNSDAVPYLVRQLKYDRSGGIESILRRLQTMKMTYPYVKSIVRPTRRRSYAALALRQMGPSATAAVPALLEAWARDKTEVKGSAAAALGAILYEKFPEETYLRDFNAFESMVVADAARRCPDVASALGISALDSPGCVLR